MKRAAWWVLVVMLAAVTLAAAFVGDWQWQAKSRRPPPVADQPADLTLAIQAATSCTVKILTYSPGTLDRDFAAAKTCLTGDFLAYYDQFFNQTIAPSARDRGLTTSATVARAGVQSLTNDSAAILVFVNQSTTSKDKTEPAVAASSALVSMTKVKGTWLVDKFNPV
ncbi:MULTISPECIES: hypothetical protein [Mycobacterium]|uniref:Twin-arginine translocation pathway signal n=1 Tax=Mycobacterium kiyosense TaxID=2871094 RepID=A0A9P3Q4W4_9MYCO|nr:MULTISPECIES: hypothetical protein [Mycobacterium]BDB40444.1 hypothetical protein IWGMT90018_08900 [Mycobacterium kiyosense]BDE12262.1 hypothetical protein MKCMC460_11220 [Mycobacterium sp. 20KCMC460]GLB85132.1 hypothetical protein SRL2020028_43880 [Mycobacterium kiyosense]GLB88500.1 hypothetical protein SRL2020130_13170 [Mycobacterium kiyosense]GLB94871.1 hypothetical protein SRL2020226_16470 [Mycobacterium kiyosense]